jgi:hypothetical protein
MRRRLADADTQNKNLAKLIHELEKSNDDLTTDYLAPDLFNMDKPPVDWLRTEVNATVPIPAKHRHRLPGQLADRRLA